LYHSYGPVRYQNTSHANTDSALDDSALDNSLDNDYWRVFHVANHSRELAGNMKLDLISNSPVRTVGIQNVAMVKVLITFRPL
jgi:hypothetical protein